MNFLGDSHPGDIPEDDIAALTRRPFSRARGDDRPRSILSPGGNPGGRLQFRHTNEQNQQFLNSETTGGVNENLLQDFPPAAQLQTHHEDTGDEDHSDTSEDIQVLPPPPPAPTELPNAVPSIFAPPKQGSALAKAAQLLVLDSPPKFFGTRTSMATASERRLDTHQDFSRGSAPTLRPIGLWLHASGLSVRTPPPHNRNLFPPKRR